MVLFSFSAECPADQLQLIFILYHGVRASTDALIQILDPWLNLRV